MPPKIELAKTRDFGELISDTFLFMRQNFKPLLKYFFTFAGIFVAAGVISTTMYQLKVLNFAVADGQAAASGGLEYRPSIWRMFGVEYFVMIICSMLTVIILEITVLSYMTLYKEKGNQVPTSEEVWAYIKYYFLKGFGSSILLNILMAIGFLFCFLPGFYLAPIFALVLPIMVMENTSFGYAFNRSFVLVKDNWWANFGTQVVVWIIVYVGIMLFSLPASIFTIVSTLTHAQKGGAAATVTSVPFAFVTALLRQIGFILVIIPCITLGLCYFNLTEGKDGTNLLNRINKLGNIAPDTDLPVEEY
ncbi:hypothetical protein [Mucilaginibacter dorajii]|uniref:Glycerophosphoryl diester phosphodiesterase membrane domain-containing protein n=1 Tax=Mucilaginibacter dorajii TaxID=692994 RepID=A0ABP7P9C6_9SPHI|nr:hypothetical protein [Mucilaginibacter dorajii]MCS3735234.1 hypothetical protein [Mucilaginibacter dorajii]